MEKSLESLRCIANLIPEQCACEIVASLRPALDEWEIICFGGCLIFAMDDDPDLVIPLATIHGTYITNDTFYILCRNRALHYFDREKHLHKVKFLDDTDEDIFCRMWN
ncbi:hypothetical protein [uncultured Parabacteroides sp.]|uniref:hypothetical protein n=1 Tax=Parabacteroides sp. ASD2025 TaxID=3415987 RepID=UPI00260CBD98|nr:hypothetical protein [uncultured Parabacteroides sp.]